jgi:hypothetical protein
MKMSNLSSAIIVLVITLMAGRAAAGGVLAVDFGGSYVTENMNASKKVSNAARDADFDGANDDSLGRVAFGTVFSPPKTAKWIAVKGKSNGTIYYGVSVAVLNKMMADPDVPMVRMASANRIQIGNTKVPGETLRQAVALYWTSADFLNGASAPLADENNSLSADLKPGAAEGNVRFMVQAGSKWYLSAASAKQGAFSLNGATALWHPFDPAANDLFVNEEKLNEPVTGSSLGPLTAAGIYSQTASFDGSAGSVFGLNSLKVMVSP